MDSLSLTSDIASQTLNSATNFLTAFAQNIDGEDESANLFSSILSQAQTNVQPTAPTTSPSTDSSDQSLSILNSQNMTISDLQNNYYNQQPISLSTLQNLEAACRRVVNQLQAEANQNTAKSSANISASQSTAQAAANVATDKTASSQNSSNWKNGKAKNDQTNSQTNQASTGSAAGSSSSSDAKQTSSAAATPSGSNSLTNAGSTPTTDQSQLSQQNITDALKALQQLMQFIAKQIETTSKGNTTTANSTSSTYAGDNAASSGSSQATDGNTLLSGLQNLSKLLLGDRLNAATAASQSTTSDTTNGTSAEASQTAATSNSATLFGQNGPSTQAALNELSELLSLTAHVVKKLDAVQVDASQTSTSLGTTNSLTAASSTLALSTSFASAEDISDATDVEMKSNLKSLLNTLQSGFANKAQNANIQSASTQTTSATGTTDNANATADGRTTKSLASDEVSAQQSQSQQSEFLNLFGFDPKNDFNPLLAPAIAQGALTNDAVLTASGSRDDSSLDLNMGSAGKNAVVSDNANLPATLEGTTTTNQYAFASQLSDARATTGGSTGLPSAVEQVILQLNRNVKSGNDQMTLQLNPSDMGRVSIKLNFSSDGKVQGTVVASNPATLDMLLKDVRGLERALQDAGLRADPGSLQFSLGGQSGNAFGQSSNDQSTGGSSNTANPSLGLTTDLSSLSTDTSETYYLTPGRVNMKV